MAWITNSLFRLFALCKLRISPSFKVALGEWPDRIVEQFFNFVKSRRETKPLLFSIRFWFARSVGQTLERIQRKWRSRWHGQLHWWGDQPCRPRHLRQLQRQAANDPLVHRYRLQPPSRRRNHEGGSLLAQGWSSVNRGITVSLMIHSLHRSKLINLSHYFNIFTVKKNFFPGFKLNSPQSKF